MLITSLSIALFDGVSLFISLLLKLDFYAFIFALFFVVSSVGIIGTTSFAFAMQNQKKSAGSAAALLGLLPFPLCSMTAPLVGLRDENVVLPMAIVFILTSQIIAISAYMILNRETMKKSVIIKRQNF